ncbi:MAG: hypothetical protein IJI85_10335 [Clostridia bacterium]|nr:hypothetical protein [Lentisphaeria bacterium]MBR0422957.1 hypothetical protein [Clostridia bacterium]
MKKIEILSPCVCAGRNMEAGMLLDIDAIRPGDAGILIGSGLAREVERYEVPERDIVPETRDPEPAKKTARKSRK